MLRALVLAVSMLCLAACREEDGGRAPFADSRVPPGLASRFFPPEGWTWGYVQSGADPPQRYGVAAPRGAPRAQALIVVGSGETAEAWFETVRDLNDRGVTVWVLERAGQAGSGRFAAPRDLIHAPSFDADISAVKAMLRLVIRPAPGSRLVLLAQGDAAVVALGAVERGTSVSGLALSAPEFSPAAPAETPAEALLRRVGLTQAKASGWRPWSRDATPAEAGRLSHDAWRRAVPRAWQTANPDLRMSGQSIGWRQAFREAGDMARRSAPEAGAPTLMLLTEGAASAGETVCRTLPDCRALPMGPARPALYLEADRFRRPWLNALAAFIGDD